MLFYLDLPRELVDVREDDCPDLPLGSSWQRCSAEQASEWLQAHLGAGYRQGYEFGPYC